MIEVRFSRKHAKQKLVMAAQRKAEKKNFNRSNRNRNNQKEASGFNR